MSRRLIVAMTGATGTLIGVRLLEMLRDTEVETHLVISRWAARTLAHETSWTVERVEALATKTYPVERSGRRDLERFVRHHGDGRGAVQRPIARRDCARSG